MPEDVNRSLYDKIIDLLHTDLGEKSAVIKWFAWKLKLLFEIADKFIQDNCITFAASLAYTTLLALAPLAAISLSILSSFDFSKTTVLNFVFNRLLPNEDIARVIEQNIDTFADKAASVSIFGVIALVLFSIWVMSTIEASFNMIWRVSKFRPVVSQVVYYWFTLTMAPILIAASIILTAKVQGLEAGAAWQEYSYLLGFTLKAIPYLLTFIVFFAVYKLIPNTTVHFRPAFIGALVAAVLFEVAKLIFNYYILNWGSYTVIYGALATIPIFLFWLYVTWIIVLLGSVVAYSIQYPKEIHSEKNEGFDRAKYINYYTLRVLVDATYAYIHDKGPLNPRVAQERHEITSELYSDILGKLHDLGFIEFVNGTTDKFLLSRPPRNIQVGDLLSRLNGEVYSVSPEPVDEDQKAMYKLFESIKDSIESGTSNLNLLELTNQLRKDGDNLPKVELITEDAETA